MTSCAPLVAPKDAAGSGAGGQIPTPIRRLSSLQAERTVIIELMSKTSPTRRTGTSPADRIRIVDIVRGRPSANSKRTHDRYLAHRGLSATAIAAHWDRWHPSTWHRHRPRRGGLTHLDH